jgi:predicted XRE-type DNA-binding protein
VEQEPIVVSSGNVFVDIGFSVEESTLLAMRAELIARLRETISERSWTQKEAAQRLGISQSEVAELVRGSWEGFTLETLVMLAKRAGRHVTLAVT